MPFGRRAIGKWESSRSAWQTLAAQPASLCRRNGAESQENQPSKPRFQWAATPFLRAEAKMSLLWGVDALDGEVNMRVLPAKCTDLPSPALLRDEHRVLSRHRSKTRSPHPGELGMQGNPQVIEYLNKALRHELTAVNQYWLHYRLLDNWGYKDLAKTWRKQSIEEMWHADKLIERIIFLDGAPNMQTLDSLHIGKTVKAVLDNDLRDELSAHALYAEAATRCHSIKDYVTRDLFEQLLHDEEKHIDFLETQIELVAKIGLELYSQHHIGEPDED